MLACDRSLVTGFDHYNALAVASVPDIGLAMQARTAPPAILFGRNR